MATGTIGDLLAARFYHYQAIVQKSPHIKLNDLTIIYYAVVYFKGNIIYNLMQRCHLTDLA